MAAPARKGSAQWPWVWVRALGNGLFFHSRVFLGHLPKLERGRRAVKKNPGQAQPARSIGDLLADKPKSRASCSGISNAKPRGREGAKSFFRLGVFATLQCYIGKLLLFTHAGSHHSTTPGASNTLPNQCTFHPRTPTTAFSAPFAPLHGKSTQVPFHEPFTHKS